MENIKEKVKEIVDSYPKLYSQIIKKDAEVYREVKQYPGDKLSEKVYNVLHDTSNTCPLGNNYKFRSLQEGYKFCGRANVCECAKQSVSKNVSVSKQQYTDEQKQEINQKREQTNLEKYGVTNAGQTYNAIENHKQFYKNKDNVENIVSKVRNTKQERYGDENYNNREKSKTTCKRIYGVSNPMQHADISNKSKTTKAKNFNPIDNIKISYPAIVARIRERFNLELLVSIDEYEGVVHRPMWKFRCLSCDYEFSHRYDAGNYPRCKVCQPATISYKSAPELEILEFIKSRYNGKVISGDRSIINPYEIDIYLPDKNIAIEYCGLYWHSELSAGKKYKYHYNKYEKLKQKGIQLLTIFSDEYENNRQVVLESIDSKLNLNNTNAIYARNTCVSEVPKTIANDFLRNYHLQGETKSSSIFVGLYQDNDLVAVNSFRKNYKEENHYELTRFASRGRIVGGSTKLLSYFVNEYNPEKIITFSDNRWSNGKLYEVMGFTKCGDVPPMQSYVKGYDTRYHKLYFSKKKLSSMGIYDETKTEWEIMQSNGYDRIWDCGKIKWQWTK